MGLLQGVCQGQEHQLAGEYEKEKGEEGEWERHNLLMFVDCLCFYFLLLPPPLPLSLSLSFSPFSPPLSLSSLFLPTCYRESRRDAMFSVGKSSTLLSQVFSLLIRQLAETLDYIYEVVDCPTPPYVLPGLSSDPDDLYKFVWAELEEVWVWLFNSMDMLESQLRFGSSMSRKVHICAVSAIGFP